jgi:hypothetical protein
MLFALAVLHLALQKHVFACVAYICDDYVPTFTLHTVSAELDDFLNRSKGKKLLSRILDVWRLHDIGDRLQKSCLPCISLPKGRVTLTFLSIIGHIIFVRALQFDDNFVFFKRIDLPFYKFEIFLGLFELKVAQYKGLVCFNSKFDQHIVFTLP